MSRPRSVPVPDPEVTALADLPALSGMTVPADEITEAIGLRRVLETTTEAFVSMDSDGRVRAWNPAAERLLGWHAAEVIGRVLADTIIPEPLREAHAGGMQRFMATGEARVAGERLALPALHRDGHVVTVEVVIWPNKVEGIWWFHAFLHDISDRVASEERLRRERLFLSTVLDSLSDGVVACDAAAVITTVNPSARQMHGRPAPTVPMTEVFARLDARHPDGTPMTYDELPLIRALHGEIVVDAEVVLADRRVVCTGRQLRDATGAVAGAVVAARDVTAERAAESYNALLAARLRQTIAVQREVIEAAADRTETLRLVADRALEMFPQADGAAVAILDGDEMVYTAVAGSMTPNAGLRLPVATSFSGHAVRAATTMRCDDPDTDPRMDREACRRAGLASALVAPLLSEDQVTGVLLIISRRTGAFDDSDAQHLELLGHSLSGGLRHADDYAEINRLLAERTAALSEVEAANALKLDLIGMLGHEIATPLMSILSTVELTDDVHEMPEALQLIGRQATRLDTLVREVLTQVALDAGRLHADREPVALGAAIAAAIDLAAAGAVPVDGDASVSVLVNRGHLQQMLVNYLTNAAKYGGGAVAVEVTRTAENAIRVAVRDAGDGVPGGFRDQLFSQFSRARRTAASKPGTGLGLYIVRGLARANGGDAGYLPAVPHGSIFYLDLETA
ncbi:PAS domain S-box-containing protein [Catenuloplanes nepalensis]|uniref:Sensor-like histidine kinase SenX3 n=1 Tax=Catenuloplanes nepalensis TaxID=587533 RepID=A0ABT9MVF3_9ACTN|nr:PAS domain S-box protein [Catenuloplanes nepalensis]MDP9795364.1 PAS domain S-box-containing protein [Catenuloplanes nepalensis]